MARKTREQFAQIIEREFRNTLEIKPAASVLVDMSEDEVIRVLYANDIYECDCDSDEEFIFVSKCNVVTFAIPADYLEERAGMPHRSRHIQEIHWRGLPTAYDLRGWRNNNQAHLYLSLGENGDGHT